MKIKKIFRSLTPTSLLWLFLGLMTLPAAAFVGYKWRMIYLAVGLLFCGFGGISCGLTNGFTDQSPNGRYISKFGIAALLIGIALTIYNVYNFV